MNSSQITFIVPIYNGEKYLRQCLDSIRFQTYTDWTCILVNDGSQDNSGKICEEYVTIDSRFKVIHKKNGGVSSARNIGMSHAQTKWITFVDSDDLISEDYLAEVCPFLSKGKYGTITISAERISDSGETSLYTSYGDEEIPVGDFIKKYVTHYISCGYFLDLDIINNNNLRFDESLSMSEDAVFMMHYFQFIPSVYTMSAKKYFYRINGDSVNNTGMNYKKSLNHYNAGLQIHSLKSRGLLPLKVIDHAVRYQLNMFFMDIRMIDMNKKEYSDLQMKINDLNRLLSREECPDFLIIASYSVRLYRSSYSSLCRIRRNWRRIKKLMKMIIG